MEEKYLTPIKKSEEKPFMKKKVVGIPMMVLVIMGVGMVLAAATIIYIYQGSNTVFHKTINVNGIIPGTNESINQYVSVSATGDIGNTLLNCNLNGGSPCVSSTGLITLTNSDPVNDHTCEITTVPNAAIGVVYLSSLNETLSESTPDVISITVPHSSTAGFTIEYRATINGTYDVETTVNCPQAQ